MQDGILHTPDFTAIQALVVFSRRPPGSTTLTGLSGFFPCLLSHISIWRHKNKILSVWHNLTRVKNITGLFAGTVEFYSFNYDRKNTSAQKKRFPKYFCHCCLPLEPGSSQQIGLQELFAKIFSEIWLLHDDHCSCLLFESLLFGWARPWQLAYPIWLIWQGSPALHGDIKWQEGGEWTPDTPLGEHPAYRIILLHAEVRFGSLRKPMSVWNLNRYFYLWRWVRDLTNELTVWLKGLFILCWLVANLYT